jgi:hypothetical protein
MSKTQVAAYVTVEQKTRLAALADLELCSLSTMLTKLIDEAYELNFGDDDDDDDDDDDTEHLHRGEF